MPDSGVISFDEWVNGIEMMDPSDEDLKKQMQDVLMVLEAAKRAQAMG